jgi:hypothetical protein
MPASERYGRKGREVTKGNYEKDYFSSSSRDGIGRRGSIDGERRRAVLHWDSGAGGEGSGSSGCSSAGSGLCSARARGLRSGRTGCLRAVSCLCAAGGLCRAESLLPAGTRGSVWF